MWRGKPGNRDGYSFSPLWEDYRELASECGLRACWSTPILTEESQGARFIPMYYAYRQAPTGSEAGSPLLLRALRAWRLSIMRD